MKEDFEFQMNYSDSTRTVPACIVRYPLTTWDCSAMHANSCFPVQTDLESRAGQYEPKTISQCF